MNYKFTVFISTLMIIHPVSAATLIDLQHKPITYLEHFFTNNKHLAAKQTQLEQVRTYLDFNNTTHIRLQQTYAGIPIWNAAAVLHLPHVNKKNSMHRSAFIQNDSTVNGKIYEGIEKDLSGTPDYVFGEAQKAKALQQAKFSYQKQTNISEANFTQEVIKMIIYVDENNLAHYAYLISFFVNDKLAGIHRPTYITDASSLKTYRNWDQVKTLNNFGLVSAGGIGGNEKIGELVYDGDTGHLPALSMIYYRYEYTTEDGEQKIISECALRNDHVVIKDVAYGGQFITNKCYSITGKHNNVYWLDWDHHQTRWKNDEMNGGFSPSLDVFYGANTIRQLFLDWYEIPVLTEEDGKTPLVLTMEVHFGRNVDNAFSDGKVMTFGDGGKKLYPPTSLDVVAHEIGHGFTEQHSYIDSSHVQMAALHESFSDMTSIAAQYYVSGNNTNSWDIGRSVMKGEGALRYFDDPLKDGRSIDHMKDFEGMDPHLLAGVFNKAFYLIATSPDWDTRKAYNVMVKANMHYWNVSMKTFAEAACGVLSATKDYKYNIADVRVAFTKVGIETSQCEVHK